MTNRRWRPGTPILPQANDASAAAAGQAASRQQQDQNNANALAGQTSGWGGWGMESSAKAPLAPTMPAPTVGGVAGTIGGALAPTTPAPRTPRVVQPGTSIPSGQRAPDGRMIDTNGDIIDAAPSPSSTRIDSPTPPPTNPATPDITGTQRGPYAGIAAGATNYATGAGTGVKQNADGSYTLPNGTVLGQGNTFTLGVGGNQIRVPGNYNGSNQALWQNNGTAETAMDRFSRRMNDLAVSGVNVNDPNIQYNEMARIRDDATAALTQQLGRPPTAQELVNATGFAHINNFVRGANGETGYQGAPAPGGPPAGGGPPATPGGPPAAPGGPPATQGGPPATTAAPQKTSNTGGPPPADAKAGDPNPNNPNERVAINPNTGQKSYVVAQDLALQGNDPDAVNTRRAMLMRSLGLDPTAQGLFYNSINKNLGDAMDRFLSLQGLAPGTDYYSITDNMHKFENMVTGGDYYGQLHANTDAARQAFLNGGRTGLTTPQQLGVLDQLNAQRVEGMNPVLAQAMMQRSQQARSQLGMDTQDSMGRGQGEIKDPVAWLRNSRWADLLG